MAEGLARFARLFPFFVDTCPECGDILERDHVRAPSMQDSWHGVEADVCPSCGFAEAVGDEPL